MIETIRAFKSTEPYTHLKEFRPLGLEDWSEKIEGDTKVNIKVDEKTGQDLISKYAGPFSQIVSLQNSDPIRHDRDTPAYTNHVTNPSYEGYSGAVDVRRNLIPNPSFESGITGWASAIWITDSRARSGSGAKRTITGNETSRQMYVNILQANIKPGATYSFSCTVFLESGNTGASQPTDQRLWAAKRTTPWTTLMAINFQASQVPKRVHGTFTIPDNFDDDINLGFRSLDAGLIVTDVLLEENMPLLPYFDGSTRGEFGAEESRRNLFINPRNTAMTNLGNATRWGWTKQYLTGSGLAQSSSYVRTRGSSFGLTRGLDWIGNPAGTPPAAQTWYDIKLEPGESITLSSYVRVSSNIDQYWYIRLYDGAGSYVPSSILETERELLRANEWIRISATYTNETDQAGYILPATYIDTRAGSGWTSEDTLDMTALMAERGDKLLPYFDGSYNPNPDSRYKPGWLGVPNASESVLRAGSADLTPRWTGTPNNSPSALAGTLPANTQVGNNDAVIAWESTVNPRNGPTHVRAMTRNNKDTASIYFFGTEGISAGDEISTGISIRPQYPVTFYIRGPKTENGMDLFQEDIEPGNDYTEYKVQGIASEYTTGDPGGATLEFSNVGIGHDWEAGTYIDFDNYFVYKGITDHPYKDGDTTGWYWNGQRHASTSSSYERLAVENYIYDSYYVQKITPDIRGRTYTLECVGIKEYLDYRLAIPAGMNPANGVITIPDGSVEEKPIPANQRLYLGSRTYKGIIKGLIDETSKLEELPLEVSNEFTSGTRERNYLLKDLRTIKEAIDNIIGNQEGPDVIFDGGFGDASRPKFFMTADTPIRRGEIIELSSRKSEIFRPDVEVNQNEYVNNLWVAGNASDGNMIIAHKTVPVGSGPLLQRANTQRSDISTSAFLLDYTLGIIEMAGSEIRAMRLKATNTKKFFQARPGYIFYLKAPEDPTIHNTLWKIVEREIRREQIVFDLVEVTL